MPNAFDRFMNEKVYLDPTNSRHTDGAPPWRSMRAGAEPPILYQGTGPDRMMSPNQMVSYTQTQDASDPLAQRARRMSSSSLPVQGANVPVYIDKPDVVRGTHSSVMRMPSGFAAWVKKLGPRGLMSLFSPAGVV